MPAAKSSKSLAQRILAVTNDLGAVGKKGQMRGGGGNYGFHRIDDIEDALRGLLVRHGVAVYPSIVDHAIECSVVRERAQYSTECTVDVTLVNADNPDDRQTLRGYGQGLDFSDKGPGKAMSYAIKSLYLFLFHLKGQPDNEDHDIQRGHQSVSNARSPGSGSPGSDNGNVASNGSLVAEVNDLKRKYIQLFPQAKADNWKAYVSSYLNEGGEREFDVLDSQEWTAKDISTIRKHLTETNEIREPVDVK